ncbi:MAG: PAS-domain containing protein [Rhodospirillales bacterium]|nr:PAS-domain containing protein [Rhodospirillales bacterium]
MSQTSVKVTVLYVAFAALWIVLSDWLVQTSFPHAVSALQSYKGLIFVIVTALCLYGVLRAELAQRERLQQNLQAILDNVEQGVAMFDDNLKLRFWNKRWRDVVDVPEEIYHVGLSLQNALRMFADKGFCGEGNPAVLAAKRAEQLLAGVNETFTVGDASYHVFSQRLAGGGLVITYTDVSETRKMESRLRQAEKMDAIGNLAGGVAHDLKNMLLPIVSLTGMTMNDLPNGSRERLRLEKVLQAAERARALVERIHAFSYKQDDRKEIVDVRDIMDEALNILQSSMPKTITLESRIWPGKMPVCVEATLIEAALLNLASNAADAMKGNTGKVTFSAEPVHVDAETKLRLSVPKLGAYAKLSVMDTGSGMDAETIQRIFEPYFTTKQRGEGSGLGLALVQKAALEHGGGVSVSSALGRGATFDVYLPLHEEIAPCAVSPSLFVGEFIT